MTRAEIEALAERLADLIDPHTSPSGIGYVLILAKDGHCISGSNLEPESQTKIMRAQVNAMEGNS